MQGFAQWLQATAFSQTVQTVSWVIPLLQSIHILTIGVVFISSLMIALRVLGQMRADEPFGAVWQRFAPWMWSGLVLMALTGITLIVLGIGATLLYGYRMRAPRAGEFSTSAKAASIAIIVLWLTVIFLGRAIAYDKEVWGSLSLHA